MVMTKAEWKRKRRRRKKLKRYAVLAVAILLFVLLILLLSKVISWIFKGSDDGLLKKVGDVKVQEKLLTINEYSRCGSKMNDVKNVVIHYSGTPNVPAKVRRDYYESLKDTRDTKKDRESMHFIVDLDGGIIQCIPINEAAYASKAYNESCISIEFCNVAEDGSMNKSTYESLVLLTAEICKKFDLTSENVVRHYDITSADCPHCFVNDADAWNIFKSDVDKAIKGKDFTINNPVAH